MAASWLGGEHYVTLGSAASRSTLGRAPVGGCERWLRCSTNVGDKDTHALRSSAKVLVVRLRLSDCKLLCIVGRVPKSDLDDEAVLSCWGDLERTVSSLVCESDSLMRFLDTNSKVVFICSPSIGDVGADRLSFGGGVLHQFLLRFDLALPVTFRCDSEQGDAWTCASPHGSERRIDFIAVPVS